MPHHEPRTDSWPDDVEAAYRQHLDALVGHARQVCPDQGSAEDACHDVFLRIVRTVRSAGSLRLSYLVVAVRNACRDYRRRERKWQPLGPAVPEPTTTPSPDRNEDDRSLLLIRLWSSLSQQQQRVLTLWADDRSYQEIADTLELSVKSVNTHIERAKAKLRMLAEREREASREWGIGSREWRDHRSGRLAVGGGR